MHKHDKPSYENKRNYQAADGRTPQQRERELLRGAQAEGREQPLDGSRPLSAAHGKDKTGEGSLRHLAQTGLPPGISEEDAEDPGANASGTAVKNRS